VNIAAPFELGSIREQAAHSFAIEEQASLA
jgi:hypothetical protein